MTVDNIQGAWYRTGCGIAGFADSYDGRYEPFWFAFCGMDAGEYFLSSGIWQWSVFRNRALHRRTAPEKTDSEIMKISCMLERLFRIYAASGMMDHVGEG